VRRAEEDELDAYVRALNGIAARHGLVLSGAAQQMMTAPVVEAAQYPTFNLDEAIRSTELVLMAMAGERKGLHTAPSVIRAFAKAGPRLPPFSAGKV
jgi:hypothetical protein